MAYTYSFALPVKFTQAISLVHLLKNASLRIGKMVTAPKPLQSFLSRTQLDSATAMALISIIASGEKSELTSTIVSACAWCAKPFPAQFDDLVKIGHAGEEDRDLDSIL